MFFKKIILPTLLLFGLVTLGQQIPVKRGPRQKINLDAIADSAFFPGKILIKLRPGLEKKLPSKITKSPGGNFRLGIPPLDNLNKQLRVSGLRRSFEKILKSNLRDNTHKAWGFDRWLTVDVPRGTNIKAAITKLKALTDIIEEAEPSFKRVLYDNDDPVQLWVPSDSAFYRQWNFNHTNQEGPTSPAGIDADIDLPEAWELEKGKPNVIVALIDGGIDTSHPDLRQNLWRGTGTEHFGYNWFDNTTTLQANPHGTHTCGTIAAVNNNRIGIAGIAGGDGSANSGVRIMNMQIFSSNGTVYAGDEATANAFIYSADRGAAIAQNSWGGGGVSTIISDAIDYFIMNGGGTVLNGGIVLFSAGNSGNESESFPGNYSPVICVGATNYDDKKSWYSSYGPWIDIMAPGGELNVNGGSSINGGRKGILSTVPANTGALYGWNHGTSMACPHVSGVAALCISKVPGKLRNDQLRQILLESTDNIYPQNPDYIGKLGTGRINAYLAVRNAALMGGALVDSVRKFAAIESCGNLILTWLKNAANNNVIVAESDSLIFGIPAGAPETGDKLEGGGTIIYKGNADNLTRQIPTNKKKYYRIWSYSGGNYSFHKTVSVIYSIVVSVPTLTNSAECDIRVEWSDDLSCEKDSVLLLANNHMPFGKPSGVLRVGDTVSGGAVVIYKGRQSRFDYTTNFDSSIYIQKWNFNSSHEYTNADDGNYDFVNKQNSIASVTAVAQSSAAIKINWASIQNDCFGGNEYLLAYSPNGVFGFPSGPYVPGQLIDGGGKVLYVGSGLSFTQLQLNSNTAYCYRVWKVRDGKIYSSGKQVCSRTLCENSLITLPYNYGFNGDDLSDPDVCQWDVVNPSSQSNALKIVEAGNNPQADPVSGSGMLRFNAYNIQNDQTATLLSRSIRKGIGKSMDVRFRWYQDSSNYASQSYSREGVLVQWSTDKLNWKNLEFYPRVPVHGLTGWSYKQISLPGAALPADTIYLAFVFTSKFGNNCYLDELQLKQSTYKPSDGSKKFAACESTDSTSMWTHYYDTAGDRLLSIFKNKNDIGKAGEAAFRLWVGGNAKATYLPSTGNNYVLYENGWASMNRYYQLETTKEPTDTMDLQFYYSTNDFNALSAAAASLQPPLTSPAQTDLYGYKINNVRRDYDCDPTSLHKNIPQAERFIDDGFFLYTNAASPDTAHWKYTDVGNGIHSMIYPVIHSGGGSLGIGNATATSALAVQWLGFTVVPNQNQALLTWHVQNERQVVYYEVEYSMDGIDFISLGRVNATTGTGEKTYGFQHILPPNGLIHYRIKAVDIADHFIYSSTEQLNFTAIDNVLIRPNPATNHTIIQAVEIIKSIRIFDASGKLMTGMKPANRLVELNVSTWAKGIYLVQVLTESNTVYHERLVRL